MRHDLGTFLAWALRVQAGRGSDPGGGEALARDSSELARQVVLAVLVAQLLAGAQHDGPPHPPQRAPRRTGPGRRRLPRRGSLAGRRPRG